MKYGNTVYFIIVAIVIFGAIVMGVELAKDTKALSLERHIYEGCVTAIKENDNSTYVWLNSKPKKVYISGNVELQIGREYEITLDGNGSLINAKILD